MEVDVEPTPSTEGTGDEGWMDDYNPNPPAAQEKTPAPAATVRVLEEEPVLDPDDESRY